MNNCVYYRFKNSCILVLSFFCLAWAHPSSGLGLSAILAMTGLCFVWVALCNYGKKTQRVYAFLGFSLVVLFQLKWMIQTDYHGVYIFFVWILVSTLVGAQYTLLSMYALSAKAITPTTKAILLSGFSIALEMSRELLFSGFPFASLSLALVKEPSLIQLASLIGVYGLTGVLVIANFFCYLGLRLRSARHIINFCIVISILFSFGAVRFNLFQPSSYYDKAQIVLLQTGWAPEDKVFIKEDQKPLSLKEQWEEIFQQLSKIQNSTVDLVVLPESVVSNGHAGLIHDHEAIEKLFRNYFNHEIKKNADVNYIDNSCVLQNLSCCLNTKIIAGLDYYDYTTNRVFNGAFYFTPNDSNNQSYFKQVLVPMGEYLPFDWLKNLGKKYGLHAFYTPGTQHKQFTSEKFKISPSICYEECFSYFIRKSVNAGTDILVNLTNDGWFDPSSLPLEHLYLAQFRAVENGRWIIRSCNTGVTCIIDPFGKIFKSLPLRDGNNKLFQGLLIAEIDVYKTNTYFQSFGGFFIKVFSFVSLVEILREYFALQVFRRKFSLKKTTL